MRAPGIADYVLVSSRLRRRPEVRYWVQSFSWQKVRKQRWQPRGNDVTAFFTKLALLHNMSSKTRM
jgi:hypothetical protein